MKCLNCENILVNTNIYEHDNYTLSTFHCKFCCQTYVEDTSDNSYSYVRVSFYKNPKYYFIYYKNSNTLNVVFNNKIVKSFNNIGSNNINKKYLLSVLDTIIL